MPRESAEVRLIRETLEGVLHPATVSSVLFEALSAEGGALPRSPDDIQHLVSGALARSLAQRLGNDVAASLVERISTMLHAIPQSARRRDRRQDDPTREYQLHHDVFPVFVLAGSRTFGEQLGAALGPIMNVVFAGDADMLRARVDQVAPAFVIVDAADFPAIEPQELAGELLALSSDVVKAIWGADLPYGMSAVGAAQSLGLSLTLFDRREGIEPLMDMIRSRRAG